MLCLTRRPGETTHIGEDVTLVILGIKGNQVRIGIQAPKGISVDRSEVRERKNREVVATRKRCACSPEECQGQDKIGDARYCRQRYDERGNR